MDRSKELDWNKYTSNSSKGCVLEVDLEYPLAPDTIEIKRETLSDYQLKIADLYSIPIVNVKKLVSNFFDKDSLWKLKTLIEAWIKAKKIHRVLEFNQYQWLKLYIAFIA